MFERLPTVPTSQELVDRAFRRSKRAASSQNKDEAMLMTAGNILSDNLANLVRKYPSFMNIPPFYYDLADAVVGVDEMRIHLSRVTWAASQIRTITKDHLTRMKGTADKPSVRRAAFGRMASVMKSIEPDLLFLNDARQKLRFMPTVDPDVPTIIVAGYPNVGKSSFMISVTGARPEIASYPFTTKGVGVGHFIRDHQRYQVVDTPGLLDRPLSQRNEIELQAIAALRHLRGAVLFILDPSEYCGFSLEEQLRLLSDVRGWLHLPVLVVANKSDLSDYGGADMMMSTQSGAGVAEVLDRMVEMLSEVEREEGGSIEE
jgi:nucleolar GTP-binding protein